MPTALMISPHADDAAAFCGGTLAKFAAEGWRVIVARVTDDAKDSVGLTVEETKRKNAEELQAAAKALGVSEIIELGFPTDCLADQPLGPLREKIVYLFRKHRPYAVFTFDPSQLYEDNLDHVRVAQATAEAFWVSAFDLHYPEHFQEGLAPFSVCERWYFGRELVKPTHFEDITDHVEKKIAALLAHETMMRHLLHQYILQSQTWGRRVPWIESSFAGDMRPLISLFIQESGKAVAASGGLGEGRRAECFRLVRFGDLEPLFQMASEPIPGAPEPPKRKSRDGENK